MRSGFAIFVLWLGLVVPLPAAVFSNPLIASGADPWVLFKDGSFYYTQTTGGGVRVQKASQMTGASGLANATAVTVFTPATPNNKEVWAPELHFLQNKWYIYFAADDGTNENHRLYVAESATPQGSYVSKGKIYDATDRWAIDGTVLQKPDGSLFLIWSGWPATSNGKQNLYIAPMSNPWTISGPRVLISTPTYSWEGWINEGPEIIQRNGKIFIIYSANASWTDSYCFGLLTCTNGDVLNPLSWKKKTTPIFKTYTDSTNGVYGPGHGSFTKSADQTEDWLFYHAAIESGAGWDRSVRIQKFTWNTDDSPNFGHPFPTNIVLTVPSGEGANILSASSLGNGSVSKSPNQSSYVQNAKVTLTALTNAGALFAGWQGDAAGMSNPLVVTMDTNKTIRAMFTNQTFAPTILTQPSNTFVSLGSNGTFFLNASGTSPMTYEWRFNGNRLANVAATNTLLRTNVQAGDAGYYSVLVSNAVGAATSSNAILFVQIPLQFSSLDLGSNGRMHFAISGTFQTTNTISCSSNLVDWMDLTNVVIGNAPFEFIDPGANAPQRFYRVTQRP